MGKRFCPLKTCENKERGKMKRGTKMLPFPSNFILKKKWEDWVNAVNAKYLDSGKIFEALSRSVICSSHFESSCFSAAGNLLGAAIPSVFQEMSPAKLFRLNLIRSESEADEFYLKKPTPSSKITENIVVLGNIDASQKDAQPLHGNNVLLFNLPPPNSKEGSNRAVFSIHSGEESVSSGSEVAAGKEEAQSVHGNNILIVNMSSLASCGSTNINCLTTNQRQPMTMQNVPDDKENAASSVCVEGQSCMVQQVPVQLNTKKECVAPITGSHLQNNVMKHPISLLHTHEERGLSFHFNNDDSDSDNMRSSSIPEESRVIGTVHLDCAQENASPSALGPGNVLKGVASQNFLNSASNVSGDGDWISLLDFRKVEPEITFCLKSVSVNGVENMQLGQCLSSNNVIEMRPEISNSLPTIQEFNDQSENSQTPPIFEENQISVYGDSMMEIADTKACVDSYTEKDFATPRRRQQNLRALKYQVNQSQQKLKIANEEIRGLKKTVDSLTRSLQRMEEEKFQREHPQ